MVGTTANDKLREKLRQFYFQGNFDLQPFFSMRNVWMPFVLDLIIASDGNQWNEGTNLNVIYRFIRNVIVPGLFN